MLRPLSRDIYILQIPSVQSNRVPLAANTRKEQDAAQNDSFETSLDGDAKFLRRWLP